MPPLRLESSDKLPKILGRQNHSNVNKPIHYNSRVKMPGWEVKNMTEPYDNDPYHPQGADYSLSHYNRFGTYYDEPWTTTTQTMLEQVYKNGNKSDYPAPNKKSLVNFVSYEDVAMCKDFKQNDYCQSECSADYMSTMQDSYSAPYRHIIKSSSPKTPFLKYRKLKPGNPKLKSSKIFDKNGCDFVKILQANKMEQHRSFNPMTGMYTDTKMYNDSNNSIKNETESGNSLFRCFCCEQNFSQHRVEQNNYCGG